MKITLLAAVALSFVVHGAAHSQRPASRASVANGQATYLRIGCQACHGTVGQGGAGVRLDPARLPLDALRVWVRSGSPGWSFARGMPAYSPAVLSDAELVDIQAFIASLPAPRAVQDIPQLNP